MFRRASFFALVLAGGAVFGCGGVVSNDTGGTGSQGAGSTNGADQGSGGSGGGFFVETGGFPTASAGAFPTGGGAVGGSVGGFATGGAPSSTEPGPTGCKPAQWDCYSAACDQQNGLNLVSAGCVCDEGRPESSVDCKPDEVFVCDYGYFRSEGVDVPLKIQCRCVANATDCAACAQTFIGAVVPAGCTIDFAGDTGKVSEIFCGCYLQAKGY